MAYRLQSLWITPTAAVGCNTAAQAELAASLGGEEVAIGEVYATLEKVPRETA